MLSTLIHEFNHSFINYLSDEKTNPANNQATAKSRKNVVTNSPEGAMQKQAYGNWQTSL
jgi:hypothetical protein